MHLLSSVLKRKQDNINYPVFPLSNNVFKSNISSDFEITICNIIVGIR